MLVSARLSLFMVGLDNTIVNVGLPDIGRDLHAGVSGLQWTVAAYTIALAALLMFSGAVADRIGRRTTSRSASRCSPSAPGCAAWRRAWAG